MRDTTSAVWIDGYETAIHNVLYLLRKEFPKPTLGIQKAMRIIEALDDTE